MSGLTSQPAMGAVCMALEQTKLGTGIRYDDIQALNLYWSQVRMLYSCFEANVRASDSSVFDHEMPGGQYTNLMVSCFLDLLAWKADGGRAVPSCAARIGDAMVECVSRLASKCGMLIKYGSHQAEVH